MKIIVFGATGGTGREVVTKALAAGHEVTAFARRPEAVTVRHDRLRVAQGDVLDAGSVAAAVAGHDAVLTSIGPAAGTKPGTLISTGTRNILAAMAQHGVRKLVFESGLMVGDGRGMNVLKRSLIAFFRMLNRALFEDKVIAEQLVRESGVEWVIVRPPNLKHVPGRGKYRVGPDLDVDLLSGLAHADVADFMVAAASDGTHTRAVLDISY